MKKIILVHATLTLCTSLNIFATHNKFENLKSKAVKAVTKTDKQFVEKNADLLIINFLNNKKIKLQDIPKEMLKELSFKKNMLIEKLDDLARRNMDKSTKDLKTKKAIAKIFEDFAQRIKYVQVTDWNDKLIKAIKESKSRNNTLTSCSYPNIHPNNRYLMAYKPE